MGVGVGIGVGVGAGVGIGVGVGVGTGVGVGLGVAVGAGMEVGVETGAGVNVGVGTGVGLTFSVVDMSVVGCAGCVVAGAVAGVSRGTASCPRQAANTQILTMSRAAKASLILMWFSCVSIGCGRADR